MKTTSISKNGRSLLAYVLSRLRPEVFTHPIWVHFGDKSRLASSEIIEELFNAAKQLQDDDPDCACQVLLLCAVYQNYAEQRCQALRTLQQILSLAERTGLPRETTWATWGASAVCIQDGNYEQAVRYLQQLQSTLREQNEWVLVDFVETVEQALIQKDAPGKNVAETSSRNPPSPGLMDIIFDWLQHWGFAVQLNIPEFRVSSNQMSASSLRSVSPLQSLWSSQRWLGFWHTLNQALRGELKLRWVPQDGHRLENQSYQELVQNRVVQELKQVPVSFSPPTPLQALVHSPGSPKVSPVLDLKGKKASLLVYCMGAFQVYLNDQVITKWPGNKCKQILKYLVFHLNSPVNQEVLMELFWPGMDTKGARRNLYQGIYNLRQALQHGSERDDNLCILTEGDNYRLNPQLDIWVDSEAFDQHYQIGQKLLSLGRQEEAMQEFEAAENLYQGEFLAEDRYEDWPLVHRENLKNAYLNVLDQLGQHFYSNGQFALSMHYGHKTLVEDNCREDAHRRVMMCYMHLGQPHLALRQYHICVEALKQELDVPPMSATEELYQQILRSRQK